MGIINSQYNNTSPNNSLGTAAWPLDGYLYVQGSSINQIGGNLVIGVTHTNQNIKFIAGGINSENIIAQISETDVHVNKNLIVDGSITGPTITELNNFIQSAYNKANTGVTTSQDDWARNQANLAFDKANTASSTGKDDWARNQANLAFDKASSSYTQANAATAYAQSAGSYANAAFAVANTATAYAQSAGSYANSAFNKANSAIVLNDTTIHLGDTANISRIWGTDYNNPNMVVPNGLDTAWAYGSYGDPGTDTYYMQVKFWGGSDDHHGFRLFDTKTNSSPLWVEGTGTTHLINLVATSIVENGIYILPTIYSSYSQANTATDYAISAGSYANAAFIVANTATAYAQSAGLYANLAYNQANTATAYAQSAGLYANLAYNQANTAIAYATSAGSYANSSFTQANLAIAYAQSAGNYANGAFNKANAGYILAQNAYDAANLKFNIAGGEITGDVTIDGHANVHQSLVVGTGAYTILPNLIAQFTGTSDYYSQINQQNLSGVGSADVVVTADNGTDSINYIDMGIAGSVYDNTTPNAFPTSNPNDGYLYLVGDAGASYGGNLVVGTTGSGSFSDISIVQGNSFDETARFVAGQGLTIKKTTSATNQTSGALIVSGGVGVSGSIYSGNVYDNGTRIIDYVDTANTFLSSTKVSKSGDTINGPLTIINAGGTALAVTGNVTISNDLTITGNLIINGNTTSISANNLVVNDSLLYIANNNSGNTFDIGIVGHYVSDHYQHTGLVRDHTDGVWKLFSDVIPEPSTTSIDFTNALYDPLKVGIIQADTALINNVSLLPFTQSAFNHANAAFDKANTGGVQSITANSSSRITQNGTTGVVLFDLATTGVFAGTYSYPTLQVDSYGRVVTISNQTPVTSWNGQTGAVTLSSANVTSALGYTPAVDTYTQSAFDKANTATLYAQSAGSYANSAFLTANNALPKIGGEVTGIISSSSGIISSTLTSNTTVTINTSGVITTASVTTPASTSFTDIDSFQTSTYRSAKYQVQMTAGTDYHMIELNVIHDGTNVYMAQYGEVFSNSSLGYFDASIATGTLTLQFSPSTATATTVKLIRHCIVV